MSDQVVEENQNQSEERQHQPESNEESVPVIDKLEEAEPEEHTTTSEPNAQEPTEQQTAKATEPTTEQSTGEPPSNEAAALKATPEQVEELVDFNRISAAEKQEFENATKQIQNAWRLKSKKPKKETPAQQQPESTTDTAAATTSQQSKSDEPVAPVESVPTEEQSSTAVQESSASNSESAVATTSSSDAIVVERRAESPTPSGIILINEQPLQSEIESGNQDNAATNAKESGAGRESVYSPVKDTGIISFNNSPPYSNRESKSNSIPMLNGSGGRSVSPTQTDSYERIEGKPVPKHKRINYRGGYINLKTGVEYFHAYSQTPRPNKYSGKDAPQRFHREVQTKFIRNRYTQTVRSEGTQMNRTGCFVSTVGDPTFIPKVYETADELEAKILAATIRIQCFVRKTFAIRLAKKLYNQRVEKELSSIERDNKKKDIEELKRRKQIESRLHPRTQKDFEVLYNGLEKWRTMETKKIEAANFEEPVRLALMSDLMDKEAQLIQKIDRLKIAANEENRALGIQKLLDDARFTYKEFYVKFKIKTGGVTFVSTPNIIRAGELKDLFVALNLPLLQVDERLQVLLQVKYSIKEFDCSLTRELVKLIDREGDLLARGIHAKNLEGLRRRISNLFLVFVKTPEFNPEAAKYQKFPEAGKSWQREKAVYYCRGCTKYLPSTNFALSTTMKHLGKCKTCTNEENIANERCEDSAYMKMLESTRQEELKKRKVEIYSRPVAVGVESDGQLLTAPGATVAVANVSASSDSITGLPMVHQSFQLMQEKDMRYLIDTIWGAQSAISGKSNINELILTRWNSSKELSPWNCVLLTKAEAIIHDLTREAYINSYAPDFCKKITQKHIAAHSHFSQLPGMQAYVQEAFYEEKRSGKILHRRLMTIAN